MKDVNARQYNAKYYENVEITNYKYEVNIAISKSRDVKESWILVTNGNPKRAIKDYGYRFGGIESLFKNQKTNGLYIEDTISASITYFRGMYALACVTTLLLTIYGADYTKNSRCYRNIKLTTHKRFKDGSIKRVISLFNIGLILFKRAMNSPIYIRIPFRFILYDL